MSWKMMENDDELGENSTVNSPDSIVYSTIRYIWIVLHLENGEEPTIHSITGRQKVLNSAQIFSDVEEDSLIKNSTFETWM